MGARCEQGGGGGGETWRTGSVFREWRRGRELAASLVEADHPGELLLAKLWALEPELRVQIRVR
jgi:hypothetical protein